MDLCGVIVQPRVVPVLCSKVQVDLSLEPRNIVAVQAVAGCWPFDAATDKASIAQNFEVLRDSCLREWQHIHNIPGDALRILTQIADNLHPCGMTQRFHHLRQAFLILGEVINFKSLCRFHHRIFTIK